jgi:hypothetical protein
VDFIRDFLDRILCDDDFVHCRGVSLVLWQMHGIHYLRLLILALAQGQAVDTYPECDALDRGTASSRRVHLLSWGMVLSWHQNSVRGGLEWLKWGSGLKRAQMEAPDETLPTASPRQIRRQTWLFLRFRQRGVRAIQRGVNLRGAGQLQDSKSRFHKAYRSYHECNRTQYHFYWSDD